jgi:hypothetical protein
MIRLQDSKNADITLSQCEWSGYSEFHHSIRENIIECQPTPTKDFPYAPLLCLPGGPEDERYV